MTHPDPQDDSSPTPTEGVSAVVPEAMEGAEQPGIPPRRVGFLTGFLLFGLLPKRYGPHLAEKSMFAAFAAHVLAMCIGLLALASIPALQYDRFEDVDAPVIMRVRYWAANQIRAQLFESGRMREAARLILAAEVASPLLSVLFAVFWGSIMWPWAVQGAGRSGTARRSIKNALWSSTILMWWMCVYPIMALTDAYEFGYGREQVLGEFIVWAGVPLFFLFLYFRATVQGVQQCVAHPSEEDEREPRMPICEACGYVLVGLPLESNCPECGRPVGDSYGPGPRTQLAEELEATQRGGWFGKARMLRRLNRERELFDRLPVWRHDITRSIWRQAFILPMIVAMLPFLAAVTGVGERDAAIACVFLPIAMTLFFLAHSLMLWNLCWLGRARHGIRDVRISIAVGQYSAALLIPPMWVMLWTPAIAIWYGEFDKPYWFRAWEDYLIPFYIVAAASIFIVVSAWWVSCTRYGLRHSRFSNY